MRAPGCLDVCGDTGLLAEGKCRRSFAEAWLLTSSQPVGASPKRKIPRVRETESPDSFDNTVKENRSSHVRFFGELHRFNLIENDTSQAVSSIAFNGESKVETDLLCEGQGFESRPSRAVRP